MGWSCLISQPGSGTVANSIHQSFTRQHIPFIWEERLEGKKKHRPLLVWEWSDAKMGACDGLPSTCWETKIIWTLIFLICTIWWFSMILGPIFLPMLLHHIYNCCLYQPSPPDSVYWREEQSLELAQLPASLQEGDPCILFYPMCSELIPDKKVRGSQRTRTGGQWIHI